MTTLYKDKYIECDEAEMRIRAYYFPWGTTRIPYASIKSISRFEMTALRGKLRIWGSSTLRYWANLDPGRPHKDVGLILDVGKSVKPLITPDHAETVAQLLTQRSGVAVLPIDTFPFV